MRRALLLLLIMRLHFATCDLEPTFERCCGLGSNWASEGLKCSQFPAPVAGVPAEQQAICLSAVEICCIRTHRERMCEIGKEAAAAGRDCLVDKKLGGEFQKDCCEACKLGLISGSMGDTCTFSTFRFGSPWDAAHQACCATTAPPPGASTLSDRAIPTPALESLCEELGSELCAHNCIPVGSSYRCECRPGFLLQPDNKSCRRADVAQDRCAVTNPCSQKCVDTGFAVECSCHPGFHLGSDKKSCVDVDECQLKMHSCDLASQVCVNEPGSYSCTNKNGSRTAPLGRLDKRLGNGDAASGKCPAGYQFNLESQVCDDVDECQVNIDNCGPNNVCQNTIGSFTCGRAPIEECPPGFVYNNVQKTCKDINECLEATDNCNREKQYCLNTEGGFTCQARTNKSQCPAGYKYNKDIATCEDINECEELLHVCSQTESCVNEPGGYRCVKTEAQQPAACRPGYRLHDATCVDIDECVDNKENICDSNQVCSNVPGSYTCTCRPGYRLDSLTQACVDINECQVNSHECLPSQRCDNTIGSYHCIRFTSCGTGYTLNSQSGLCEDDDECVLRTDNCRFLGPIFQCRNTAGSFRCERKRCNLGLRLNNQGICVNHNGIAPLTTTTTTATTTTTTATTTTATTAAPTTTARVAFVWNALTTSKPTSSAAIICPIGYIAENGKCIVNECERGNMCRRNQRCIKEGGSYRCLSLINCNVGYEANEAGTQCVDIDECATGRHECTGAQVCVNRLGSYVCQCPPGHTVGANKQCVDVDECARFAGRICSAHSECRNTPGSYVCQCKAGFKQAKENACEDVDECKETSGLCQHNCINLWGSYYCTCQPGFSINADNRTCTDLNECELFRDRHLCIGNCVNQPGSYSCTCPDGYRLGTDSRTCQDIDECAGGSVCPNPNEICFNTRGSYRCNTIVCPPNFIRDTEHKNRCKRASLYCRESDQNCLRMPLSYTYNYMTFVSNMAAPASSPLDLFTMRGPLWQTTTARFNLELVDTRAPNAIRKVTRNFFRLRNTSPNQAVISLVEKIPGPQEIELQLTMDIYRNGEFSGSAVAKLFIYVSQYEY